MCFADRQLVCGSGGKCREEFRTCLASSSLCFKPAFFLSCLWFPSFQDVATGGSSEQPAAVPAGPGSAAGGHQQREQDGAAAEGEHQRGQHNTWLKPPLRGPALHPAAVPHLATRAVCLLLNVGSLKLTTYTLSCVCVCVRDVIHILVTVDQLIQVILISDTCCVCSVLCVCVRVCL